MSYLAEPTSINTFGVVKIGDFIEVIDGVISLPQDVSTSSNIIFNTVQSNELYDNGNRVVTSVSFTTGEGIDILSLVSDGPNISFLIDNTGVLSLTNGPGINLSTSTGNITVNNTGVLSLTAGPGINLSTSTGNITISSTGADLINVYGTTTNYTATLDDEYIGVFSVAPVTITLPVGVEGRVYIIKDEYGQGSGKITIQPQPGILVDRKTNYIISVPNQSISVVYRAGGWWII